MDRLKKDLGGMGADAQGDLCSGTMDFGTDVKDTANYS